MKNKAYLYLVCIAIVSLNTSCGSDDGDFNIGPSAIEYYPLEVGKFLEYQVDSTIYDDLGNTVLSSNSFVQELITEIILDDASNETYVIERSWKPTAESEYTRTHLWKVREQNGNIIRTEENLDFLILRSPVVDQDNWDGILFDERLIVSIAGEELEMYKAWDFTISNYGTIEDIGGFNYDNVLTVTQADDENAIERRLSIEKYQKGLGLVHKRMQILDTQCIEECEGQTWIEKAQSGFILESTLIAHN